MEYENKNNPANADAAAPPQVSMLLDARPQNMMLVRQVLEGLLADYAALDDIKLAVTEACGNVIRHAYGGDVGDMEVSLALGTESCRIEVRDQGQWDATDATPEVPGMGVLLMRKLASHSEIAVSDEGTRVTLEFEKEAA